VTSDTHWTDTRTDRQTDSQQDKQTDGQTDGQTDRQILAANEQWHPPIQQNKRVVTRQLLAVPKEPTFLTLRMDLTWAVLDAWGPPVWMDWDISSEYILQS